jgi:hypothetical protein
MRATAICVRCAYTREPVACVPPCMSMHVRAPPVHTTIHTTIHTTSRCHACRVKRLYSCRVRRRDDCMRAACAVVLCLVDSMLRPPISHLPSPVLADVSVRSQTTRSTCRYLAQRSSAASARLIYCTHARAARRHGSHSVHTHSPVCIRALFLLWRMRYVWYRQAAVLCACSAQRALLARICAL